MRLVPESIAEQFFADYKALLANYSKGKNMTAKHYAAARNKMISDLNKAVNMIIPQRMKDTLSNAQYGDFLYAKYTRLGYAFRSVKKNDWHFVSSLTTPLDEMIPNWCIVRTEIMTYDGYAICDGLIEGPQIFIGRNMKSEFEHELKQVIQNSKSAK